MIKETKKQKAEREQKESDNKMLDNEIINPFGILPDTFLNEKDYGDTLSLNDLD